MGEVNCEGKSTREINREIRRLVSQGERQISVRSPGARHNLGVGILEPVTIQLDGSVGCYCAGMIDGPTFEIAGSAGWGLAECMMSGHVVAHGSAGNGA